LPRFVTPRAGGYYFMPSRSALAYLANQCEADPEAVTPVYGAVPRGRATSGASWSSRRSSSLVTRHGSPGETSGEPRVWRFRRPFWRRFDGRPPLRL